MFQTRRQTKLPENGITYEALKVTCVPVDTGLKIAPAPATLALAFAIEGSLDPKAEAER